MYFEDDCVLVPDATYRLKFQYYETRYVFTVPRCVVHFTILDIGPHFGKKLEAWYGVRKLMGKTKRFGNFKASKKHDLYRDYVRVLGAPTANRKDRLSFAGLKDKIVLGTTRTVKQDSKQQLLPDGAQYSIIDRLEGIEA